jgi:hypothetical protein
MALTKARLNNGGRTAHYQFQYDDSLSGSGGLEPARTNAVIGACEGDFDLMSDWFGNISLGVNFPIPVSVNPSPSGSPNSYGAQWSKKGRNVTLAINQGTKPQEFVRSLMVAEVTEMFMDAQNIGWYGNGNEGTNGEGLSRFLRGQFYININSFGSDLTDSKSNLWLDSIRADYVNNPNPNDNGPDPLTGCATLFIWYLSDQLGFNIRSIVAAGTSTLGDVYKNLTGDPNDPFPLFQEIVFSAFPTSPKNATITTGNLDNPFPLASAGILSTLKYLRNDAPDTKFARQLSALKNGGRLRPVLNSDRQASLI